MIYVKNKYEIEKMRDAGKVVKGALELCERSIRAGMTTLELNDIIHDYIMRQGATPSFLNYRGYPKSVCISIDDEVVHGIPCRETVLKEGSIVSVDVGACLNGFHSDAARTYILGEVGEEKRKLVKVTEECFFRAVKGLKEGSRTGDIGEAVCAYAVKYDYGVVRDLTGHGIGMSLHEGPDIPNFGNKGRGQRLSAGMTLAIEPMINMGTHQVIFCSDGWTVKTADGKPSAHYENTVLITEKGHEILTL
jgi:methionyl aminopeptidase